MNITDYKHSKYDIFHLMNKELFPQTTFTWGEYETFNEVYQWAISNCIQGFKTKSGGIAGGPKNRYQNFYFYNNRKTSIELIIAHKRLGCYKFVIMTERNTANKLMSGKKALKKVYKLAEEFGVIDELKKEAVTPEEGTAIKKTIQPAIIKVNSPIYQGREFEHVNHIDANSSYFSRICEYNPALKPLGLYLYENRKLNDGEFKAVMTNSIGAMQSQYCLDINSKYKNTMSPFQLSKLAQIAVNGTNDFIKHYITELYKNNFEPLLINTDGIWYRDRTGQNRLFHDKHEGHELGQWKHDHIDVKLYIKSAGAYQYIEDNQVKSIVRGICGLDYIKPDRDTWGWKEIKDQHIFEFNFVEGIGVIKRDE